MLAKHALSKGLQSRLTEFVSNSRFHYLGSPAKDLAWAGGWKLSDTHSLRAWLGTAAGFCEAFVFTSRNPCVGRGLGVPEHLVSGHDVASRTMPRALWGSEGGGRFHMSEVPLYGDGRLPSWAAFAKATTNTHAINPKKAFLGGLSRWILKLVDSWAGGWACQNIWCPCACQRPRFLSQSGRFEVEIIVSPTQPSAGAWRQGPGRARASGVRARRRLAEPGTALHAADRVHRPQVTRNPGA